MELRYPLEVLLGANHHCVVLVSQLTHLLEADRVYLVVHIWANRKGKKLSNRLLSQWRDLTEARDVLPGPYQDVNEFIGSYLENDDKCIAVSERPRNTDVLSNHHVAVVQFV